MRTRTLLICLMFTALLAACQSANGATPGGFNGQMPSNSTMQTRIASDPQMATQFASGGGPGGGMPGSAQATATAIPTAQPTETPEPTATAVSPTAGAVQAAQDYFAALQMGDFSAAAKDVSAFSLMANKLTSGDVIDALTQQKSAGAAWSDFKVVGSQVFDDNTILVHVTYTLSSVDAKTGKVTQMAVDEQWPFRLEMKKWLYNWTNIIDFETLGGDAKLSNGLTIRPQQMIRYSDKIRLNVMAQNGTNEAIVIGGSANQLLGVFHFGDKAVAAENARYILDAWRTYTNVNIDVKGLYTTYPDAVEIVKVTSTTTKPWFTFALTD